MYTAGAGDRLDRIVDDGDVGARLGQSGQLGIVEAVSGRATQTNRIAGQRRAPGQGSGDVVGIAHPGDLEGCDVAKLVLQGEEVGKDLDRVAIV